MSRVVRARARARQRGMVPISNILEATMVIGWFCLLVVAERGLSRAVDARRSAEDTAYQTASMKSGAYCQGGGSVPAAPGLPPANGTPNVLANGKPESSTALSAIAGLGIPVTQTFPYYTKPLENVRVQAKAQADSQDENSRGKSFEGQRQLGCLERPLDSPKGTLDQYRHPLWQTNLQGY